MQAISKRVLYSRALGWVKGLEPSISRATIWRLSQLGHTHHERKQIVYGFRSLNASGHLLIMTARHKCPIPRRLPLRAIRATRNTSRDNSAFAHIKLRRQHTQTLQPHRNEEAESLGLFHTIMRRRAYILSGALTPRSSSASDRTIRQESAKASLAACTGSLSPTIWQFV